MCVAVLFPTESQCHPCAPRPRPWAHSGRGAKPPAHAAGRTEEAPKRQHLSLGLDSPWPKHHLPWESTPPPGPLCPEGLPLLCPQGPKGPVFSQLSSSGPPPVHLQSLILKEIKSQHCIRCCTIQKNELDLTINMSYNIDF